MTPSSVSLIFSFVSLIFSFVATAIAAFTCARVFSRELPTVEFLVVRDENAPVLYKLSVSNPTHRLLVLDHVDVLSPRADGVQIRRMDDTVYGVVDRAYEESSLMSKRTKPVFLAVPAGQIQHLEVEISDDDDFQVDFRLRWSKGLPLLYRCFIVQKVELDSAQVKSRKLAAVARAASF